MRDQLDVLFFDTVHETVFAEIMMAVTSASQPECEAAHHRTRMRRSKAHSQLEKDDEIFFGFLISIYSKAHRR